MLKFYGTTTCPDCREAIEELKKENIDYIYIDILEDIGKLKEFLYIRDNSKEFDEIKKEALAGVPLFIYNDDKISFDYKEIIEIFK